MDQNIRRNNIIAGNILLALDLASILISYIVAYYLRFGIGDFFRSEAHKIVVLCLMISSVLYSFFLEWNKSFMKRGYFVELIAITKYNLILLVIAALLVFLLRQGEFYSRLVFGYFAIVNEILMYALHILTKRIMAKYFKRPHMRIPIMVISQWKDMEYMIEKLKASLPVNYQIAALSVWDRDMIGQEICGIPVVAWNKDITGMVKDMALDEFFINLPCETVGTLRGLIRDIETMGAICHYNLDLADSREKEGELGEFGGFTVISYAINAMDLRRLLIKRLMDIAGALVGMVITIIITPVIALAIKLDSKGPVFFSQTRIGKNGRRFKLYKFRSMYENAEERKKALLQENEMNGLMFKMKDDPRITPVGAFLRKTSLDELPQFYNILMGEMSLVGTRPPTEDEFREYSLYYRRRLCMTPGLTGLWQVSGRSNISDFDEVVKLDLEYIDNWCLTLDIKIILQTIITVFRGKGAE